MVRALNPIGTLRDRLPRRASVAVVTAVTAVACVVVARTVDVGALGTAARQAMSEPASVALALGAFAAAFVLRALAWRRTLPGLSLPHALAGIHLALGGNHVLPLRLGEPLRVVSVVRRTPVATDAAIASTIALRTADTVTLLGWGALVSPVVLAALMGAAGWMVLSAGVAVAVVGLAWWWVRAPAVRRAGMRPPGFAAWALTAAAWLAEAVLVHQAARWAGLEISAAEAVAVTAASVLAQIAAIAPGGFGTYEAAAVAAYVALGYDPAAALVAALAAHALKTAYSVAASGVAAVAPAPGVLAARRNGASAKRVRQAGSAGQWDPATRPGAAPPGLMWPQRLSRMAKPWPERPVSGANKTGKQEATQRGDASIRARSHAAGEDDMPVAHDGGVPLVVLFMPAYNEEASVGECVGRAPASVLGCDVEVLVVDDGSVDATADRARAVGATVISLPQNRGLGAAVRVGLAAAVERGAAAVAFCDADGEYAPEELELLVAPVLAGDADYVVGSRFAGEIEVMKLHRRLGNIVLTAALSLVARRRISDGQSGYRAFSRSAAASAEIIHDFNYAQVITLDLLDKGCRYAEVPISYRFRTTGESFITLGRYLRHVVPAVIRELTIGRCTADTADRANPESVLDKATIV